MIAPIVFPGGKPRCPWCAAAPEFPAYHDTEWGFPDGDDQSLFEKLSLEAFQSGLIWRTILAKRAFMQAMGLINDHVEGCFTRVAAQRARRVFKRP